MLLCLLLKTAAVGSDLISLSEQTNGQHQLALLLFSPGA